MSQTDNNNQTIINQNVTSNNQSGGITAHTVNQAPPPELKQLSMDRKTNGDGTQTLQSLIEIVAPFPPGELFLSATAPGIISFDVGAQRTGIMMTGHTGTRGDTHFTSIVSPYGQYLITIRTSAATNVMIDYDFK